MDKKDVIISFAIGGIVGAGLALLFAPKSGKETRSMICKLYTDTEGKVKDKAHDLNEKFHENYTKIKDQANSAIEAGKKAFNEYTEGNKSE